MSKFVNASVFPETWAIALLPEICSPKQWKTIAKKNLTPEGYVVYGANGRIGYYSDYTHEHPTLMVTCRGATCGNLHISLPFSYINGNAMALDGLPENLVVLKYLFYALKSRGLDDVISGSAQPQITRQGLSEIDVPIPPIAEQKQIAATLDQLLARVEAIKTRLDAIPALLKRFRQSVLAAAVSGRLTEEWREDPKHIQFASGGEVIGSDSIRKKILLSENPALKKKKSTLQSKIDEEYVFDLPGSWAFSTWGKISEWITYGFTKPMPKSPEGVRLLTAKNVHPFSVNVGEAGLTTTEAFSGLSDKDRPRLGDLLITKDGSIGRAALVRTQESFCINQSIAVCWLRSTHMNKDYLEIVSNSEYTQNFIKDKVQGVAIQHLSIIDFAKCPVPVPPIEEQTQIVHRVEQLFAFADQIEQRLAAARGRVEHLTQSILAKAFRGELTAQWRADHPELISGEHSAQALLARIKAERAAAPVKKRSRKKRQ